MRVAHTGEKEKKRKTLEPAHLIATLALIFNPLFFILPRTIGIGLVTHTLPFLLPPSRSSSIPTHSHEPADPDEHPERDEFILEIVVDIDVEVSPSADPEIMAILPFPFPIRLTPPAPK